MEEGKIIENVLNEEYEDYLRVVPRIGYYMKSKNISAIFKSKCPTFALAGFCGVEERIYLFSNSLEEMGSFSGYKERVWCLCAISNRILASGSEDSIKIWDIKERKIICKLSEHANSVTTLCYVREGVFVSGSDDKSLIIWNKLLESAIYSPRHVLTRHTEAIAGIIKMNNSEIISGDYIGDLMIRDIDQGVCTRHISLLGYGILQMKQHLGEIAVSYKEKVSVWGAVNNWEAPINQFSACDGFSIEFLSGDILLRGGGLKGQLEFIYYAQIGCSMPPIQRLHSEIIYDLQRIAKNIVITASMDGFMKVIDPISRKCYLNFKKRDNYQWFAIAYFY